MSVRGKNAAGRHELTVVDLFCGAGGLSLGLGRAGFRVVFATDHDRAAAATYRRNFGDHVACGEIDEDIDLPPSSFIVGGPPCQGFSSAGQRRPGDERNNLVSVFARIVAVRRPAGFLFENVEGFLTSENGDRLLDLLIPVVEAGYRVIVHKLNAANFGVPQHRKRVVAVGGLGWTPSLPPLTHRAHGAPGAGLVGRNLPWTPSITEGLRGLPRAGKEPPGTPQGHYCLALEGDDVERVSALECGQTMRDLPRKFWHESYRRRAFRRVMDGTPAERRGGAPAGIRRLRPDEPSKAITSGARNEFVHPEENRFLSLRECARIQTFPDSFEFEGTANEQALLIGNGAP